MNDIRKLFLKEKSVSFSQIEKHLGMRSNKAAYHVKKLVNDGVLTKIDSRYVLVDQYSIPSISRPVATPMPVVLILLKKKNKVCLLQRKSFPYKNYWGLPGSRLLLEESLESCVKRIGKEDLGASLSLKNVHAVLRERVIEDNKTVQSFILFLVSANGVIPECVEWFDPNEVINLIPTDRKLIEEFSNKKILFNDEVMKMEDERLALVK